MTTARLATLTTSSSSLRVEQFACGDIVTYLAAVEISSSPVDAVQSAEFGFRFLADSTGQSGAALSDIVGVAINYGAVQAGDGPGGTDSYVQDDGGSTATLISESLTGPLFTAGSELHGTVRVTDLEAGERVTVRIDTLLACKPGTSPTGNLQGQLDSGKVVGSNDVINTGQQTIPFLKVGELAGAGEPMLTIEKSVVAAGSACPGDDLPLSVTAGMSVKYCYIVSNPGTYPLYDLTLTDDNGTPGTTADDFAVTLAGLQNLDGQSDALTWHPAHLLLDRRSSLCALQARSQTSPRPVATTALTAATRRC